jgi:hypothetical protein
MRCRGQMGFCSSWQNPPSIADLRRLGAEIARDLGMESLKRVKLDMDPVPPP